MNFSRESHLYDDLPSFDDWNHQRETARKRFDEFRRTAEEDSRMLFDNSAHWPPTSMRPSFDRPFGFTDRATSPRWSGEVPIKVEKSNTREDVSDASSLGSAGSKGGSHGPVSGGEPLCRSASSSSTGSSAGNQPKVHHIPIIVEGRDKPTNSPNGRSSGYSSDGIIRPEPNLTRSPSNSSHCSATSRRSASPLSAPASFESTIEGRFGSPEGIPTKITQMPKVKTATPGSNQSRGKPTDNNLPVQKQAGPYVTRIPVGTDYGEPNGEEQQPYNNKPQQSKRNAMSDIQDTVAELVKLETEVQAFNGEFQDKKYRYLDEMLTRCMIRLDNIDTEGNPDIRKARKEAINAVHKCVSLLETNSKKNNVLKENGVNDSETNQQENPSTEEVMAVQSSDLTNGEAEQPCQQQSPQESAV